MVLKYKRKRGGRELERGREKEKGGRRFKLRKKSARFLKKRDMGTMHPKLSRKFPGEGSSPEARGKKHKIWGAKRRGKGNILDADQWRRGKRELTSSGVVVRMEREKKRAGNFCSKGKRKICSKRSSRGGGMRVPGKNEKTQVTR